jgi:hypothetical protein
MNGCISNTCTMTPTTSPSTEPMRITSGITTDAGQPLWNSDAAVMPDSATTAPTDRSMPPARMTNVMPTASTTR